MSELKDAIRPELTPEYIWALLEKMSQQMKETDERFAKEKAERQAAEEKKWAKEEKRWAALEKKWAKEEEKHKKEEEKRKNEDETRRKEEAARRKEESACRKEETARRKEEEKRRRKEESARRKEEDKRRRKEEAARRKEEEKRRRKEEAARRKEEKKRKMEEEERRRKEEERFQKEEERLQKEAERRNEEFEKRKAENEKYWEESKKRGAEIDKRMKYLQGLFTSQWGKLIEALSTPSALSLFKEIGIGVSHIYREGYYKSDDGKAMEVDCILSNSVEIVVVEVKTTCKKADVDYFLEKMKDFKSLYHEFQGMRVYVAMVAIKYDEGSDRYAASHGLFVLNATGEGVFSMANPTLNDKRIY